MSLEIETLDDPVFYLKSFIPQVRYSLDNAVYEARVRSEQRRTGFTETATG